MASAPNEVQRSGSDPTESESCPGELLRHLDGALECSHAACDAPPAAHDWVLACDDVEGGCAEPACRRAA